MSTINGIVDNDGIYKQNSILLNRMQRCPGKVTPNGIIRGIPAIKVIV